MYDWRKMSGKQQQKVLRRRKYEGLPWPWPPHWHLTGQRRYLISAA
jgi:hypothetical protein